MAGATFENSTSRNVSPLTGECDIKVVDVHAGDAGQYIHAVTNPAGKKIVIINVYGVPAAYTVGALTATGAITFGTTGIGIVTAVSANYLNYVITYALM